MDLDGKWFYCQKIFIAFIIFSDKVSETAAGEKMWGQSVIEDHLKLSPLHLVFLSRNVCIKLHTYKGIIILNTYVLNSLFHVIPLATMFTGKWLFTCISPWFLDAMRWSKFLVTVFARIWLFTFMNYFMPLEIT